MAKTRKISGVQLTADRIAAAIVDRLLKAEQAISNLRGEVNAQMDMIAEQQAKFSPDGSLVLRAMKMGTDEASEVNVTLSASAIATIEGAQ